jgi:hypothetical protein
VPAVQPDPETPGVEHPQPEPEPAKPWLDQPLPGPFTRTSTPAGPAGVPVSTVPAAAQDVEPESAGCDYLTPIYTLVNVGSGSRVTLVSNVHVGKPGYFRQLKSMLLDLEHGGATIQVERILPPTGEQLAAACDPLRRLHELYLPAAQARRGSYASIGVVDKRAVFEPEPTSWQVHDITSLELLEFLGLTHARTRVDQLRALSQLRRGGPDVVRAALRRETTGDSIPGKVRAGLHRTLWGDDRMLRLALYREAVAIGAVDLHLARNPGTDLALCWGVAHMPGFRAAFEARGYKLESEQWITAIDAATLGP